MKILLISYGIIEYDGRLKQLLKIYSKMGDVNMYSCSINLDNKTAYKIDRNNQMSLKNYICFLWNGLKFIYKNSDAEIIVLDNYFTSLLGIIARSLFKDKIYIQDMRELYLKEDMKSMKARVVQHLEMKMLKRTDILTVANEQRANIVHQIYELKNPPLVIENVRFLPKEASNINITNKIKMEDYHIKFISTGGYSLSRGIEDIILSFKDLPNVGFFILGDQKSDDYKVLKKTILENNLKNVHLLEMVKYDELFNVISLCDVGIVNYHQKDINNIYCASGKVYEYLDAGLPILTTSNIPLKEFTDQTQTGISTDNYRESIMRLVENIDYYEQKVSDFMKNVSEESYNKKVALEILKRLEDIGENKK